MNELGNPFRGFIAFENRETVDGRIVAPDGFELGIAVGGVSRARAVVKPGEGPIGRIVAIQRHSGGLLEGFGSVLLEPGEYSVGVDLADLDAEVIDGVLCVFSARILGVTIVSNSAWPDAKITVTERR